MSSFADFNIDLGSRTGVEVPTTCPQCSHTRKKSNVRCLSVNTVDGIWYCHHCDWRGSLKSGEERRAKPPKRIVRPEYDWPESITDPVLLDWFASRGIPKDVVERCGISLKTVYMPQLEEEVPCIAFPYTFISRDDRVAVINVKYRTLEGKHFRQEKDAEKILYGIDDLTDHDRVGYPAREWGVIVEGELDKLSLAVAGIENAVSVPDGAPPAGSKPSDQKFEYLVNCASTLDGIKKLILAVDNDGPGKTLEEELARRLGPERCWRVTWPEGCKDANDVLMQHGAATVRQCIETAKPYPLDGVLLVADLAPDVMTLYREGLPGGLSTGWPSVDRHYTVRPGELTIVTGIPSHGKSQLLDALFVNLAKDQGWSIGMCSPENLPVQRHIAKLIELYTGWPFREGPSRRLPQEDLPAALDWLNQHIVFIAPEENLTIPGLLATAKQLVGRYGIRGLVIDPWNEFEHTRAGGQTESEYIGAMLGQIRRFARNHGVHVWVVAHPTKLYRTEDGSYPIPTPYDISGSAHWRNKADNCLTIWRDEQDPDAPVKLYVQKIRHREVGSIGVIDLRFKRLNGRYVDADGEGVVLTGPWKP